MKSRSREINVFSMSALDLFASALGAFILISIVLMPYFLRLSDEQVAQLQQDLEEAQASLSETRRQLEQAEGALQQCEERAQRESACREQLAELQAEVERLRAELEAAQSESAQTQPALQRCQEELEVCEEKLLRTFLIVVTKWDTCPDDDVDCVVDQFYKDHDVDLHIIDAAGREFYYSARTIPGRPGALRWDSRNSPGVEIWEVSEAPPGEYRILYNLYSRGASLDRTPIAGPNPRVKGGVSYRDGHHKFRTRRLNVNLTGRANAMLVAVVTVNDDGSVDIDER